MIGMLGYDNEGHGNVKRQLSKGLSFWFYSKIKVDGRTKKTNANPTRGNEIKGRVQERTRSLMFREIRVSYTYHNETLTWRKMNVEIIQEDLRKYHIKTSYMNNVQETSKCETSSTNNVQETSKCGHYLQMGLNKSSFVW